MKGISDDRQSSLSISGAKNRRELLRQAGWLIAGPSITSVIPAETKAHLPSGDPESNSPAVLSVTTRSSQNYTAQTQDGPASGYIRKGIVTFKGVPYADTTAGENRFMPPCKTKPWSGTRSSRQYGSIAPQSIRTDVRNNDEEAFLFNWDDSVQRVYRAGQGEDCLRLNLWTPALHDGRKRSVMVWIHGGRFSYGSGHEQQSYDGENLARRGDIVVISINHRLNVFGFLNLAGYGDRYASSANVGLLDIVTALQWIRDNVENFGGDPGNVTIFGQSGGGSKVSMLMGVPAAKGLFHRAIVESGSMLKAGRQAPSREVADRIVHQLGLNASTISRIHTLSFDQVQLASEVALRAFLPRSGGTDFERIVETWGFAPVLDDHVLPADPFHPRASDLSANVPMIVGSNLNEFTHATDHPEYEAMTLQGLLQRVTSMFGDKAPTIIKAFQRRTPKASPFDIWSHIASSGMRARAIEQCQSKAALSSAPCWLYWFTWQTPVLDARPRAFHGAEIPFVFANTDRCDTMTGGGVDARNLAKHISDAWIAFAKTGNPNPVGKSSWQSFAKELVPTMIFDDDPRLRRFPDREEQESIREVVVE